MESLSGMNQFPSNLFDRWVLAAHGEWQLSGPDTSRMGQLDQCCPRCHRQSLCPMAVHDFDFPLSSPLLCPAALLCSTLLA